MRRSPWYRAAQLFRQYWASWAKNATAGSLVSRSANHVEPVRPRLNTTSGWNGGASRFDDR